MKFTKPSIILFAMVALFAITYSCSKQENTKPVSSTPQISLSNADILIENKIRAFKSKMEFLRENADYKSGETISVDSAVWYKEAASNQTYADGASAFSKSISDTFSIMIDAINGEVLMNDVVEAYDDMIENLSATYHALPGESNHLVVNDISLTTTDESTVSFGVNAVFGSSTDGTGSVFNSAWYWGELKGREDGAFFGESDAAEEIEKMIHQRKGTLPANSYYTNVDSVSCFGSDFINPNDPTPDDNMYDYLMFYNLNNGILPNVHELLSVNEMNFYLFSTESVIYTYEPYGYRPDGQSFVSVNLRGEMYLYNYDTYRFHTGWIKYGDLHINSEPPSDL